VEEEEQGGLRIVDPHKMNLDGMGDFDENNIVAGKRRRKGSNMAQHISNPPSQLNEQRIPQG
jgi:hypothetical protein